MGFPIKKNDLCILFLRIFLTEIQALLNNFRPYSKGVVLISYFIVEKDRNVINCINEVLCEYDNLLYSGNSSDQDNALNHILKHTPDLIFLDMDNTIDGLSSFLLNIVQHVIDPPALIALSSSKEQAYDAYQYDFSNFLLKPLTELKVRKCIVKYVKKYSSETPEIICLKSNKDYQYLNMDEILFLKADNNTTDFHMKDGTKVSAYKTLKNFQEQLPNYFLRIHKSYIINSRCISRIHYGKSICVIKNPLHKIPFTKTFIQNIDTINSRLFGLSAGL